MKKKSCRNEPQTFCVSESQEYSEQLLKSYLKQPLVLLHQQLSQRVHLHLLQGLLVVPLVSRDLVEAQGLGHEFEQSLPVGGLGRVPQGSVNQTSVHTVYISQQPLLGGGVGRRG